MGSSNGASLLRILMHRSAFGLFFFLSFDFWQLSAIETNQPKGDVNDYFGNADSVKDSSLNASSSARARRKLRAFDEEAAGAYTECDPTARENQDYKRYFDGMNTIYRGDARMTCLPQHMECGWPAVASTRKKLPLLVMSVGLEGAGHHLWTDLLKGPVFDCVWVNARHYRRDIADGVPRLTPEELHEGLQTQYNLRAADGDPPCRKIYDAEDSFPTGSIRKSGRIFCRPDLVNVQKLDGILYDVKYLVIARNVTDTALSALRRNFFTDVDAELRTVEHTLTYLESALKGVPCSRIFIAHYEQALKDPSAFIAPLSTFLELNDPIEKAALASRLSKKGKFPPRKQHKLTQFNECKTAGFGSSHADCSNHITKLLDRFFEDRKFMWPTFAGNGFDFVRQPR